MLMISFLAKILGKIFSLLITGLPPTMSVFRKSVDNTKALLRLKSKLSELNVNMNGTASLWCEADGEKLQRV